MTRVLGFAKVSTALWAAIVLAACPLHASPKQTADGVIVEDFEDGSLEGWEVEAWGKDGRVEIEPEGDGSVLEVTGAKVWLEGTELENFIIEARVRRDYQAKGGIVGFLLRDDYTCDIRMVGKLRFRGRGAQFGGMTRGIQTDSYRTLKVVCAGPTARFYLDGEFEGEAHGLDVEAGRLGLYGGSEAHPVYFDDVRIDPDPDPGLFLAAVPELDDDCLVFPPDQDVSIPFKIGNAHDSAQDVEFSVEVKTWDGEAVGRGAAAVSLAGGGEQTRTLAFGRLPAGFYKMVMHPTGQVFPLAIQQKGRVEEPRRPDIYVGAYWYYFGWQRLAPMWWNTYVHACAHKLRENNFNMVVNAIGMPAETISILQTYGIASFSRGAHLDHPNVIGAFIGDEPKEEDVPRYVELYAKKHEQHPDKLFTTCMIGDGGLKGHVYNAWEELSEFNQVRMFRWYGIKKSWNGILRPRAASLQDVLAQARVPEGPYWVILPSFGDNSATAYYGNPLPGQIRSMMHLCMANEAKAVIFYTLHGENHFLGAASLLPEDGKWEAAGDVAGELARNAALLASLRNTGRHTFIDNYMVLGYTMSDGTDNYLYVVNQHPTEPADFRIFQLTPGATLHDLYNERELPVELEAVELLRPGVEIETGVAHLELAPGDGTLLKMVPPAEKAAVRAPRVDYPRWVEEVGADDTFYLVGKEAENTPMPGWVPMHDYKKNPWSSLNGEVVLYAGLHDQGRLYEKSLYAQAETDIVYEVPEGYTHFVAAAGLGSKSEVSSVVFRVIVDGVEKYRSDVYRHPRPVLPVVVDIRGAKEIRLATEDAGDGVYQDYAWWGEARLVKE